MKLGVAGFAVAIALLSSNGATVFGAGDLELAVTGLHSNSGKVVCTLWHSPEGFPRDDQNAQTVTAPIKNQSALCNFPNLPAGKYAAVAFHDENNDGKFNTNWLGLPLEGYGFSNNASISWRPPNFQEAGFTYKGGTQQTTIRIKY